MDAPTLTLPTVHMNGDSAETLLEMHREAMAAIRAAIDKLADASPNARNYYPQGPDAYTKAREEHTARIAALETIATELETIAIHVIDTDPKRNR